MITRKKKDIRIKKLTRKPIRKRTNILKKNKKNTYFKDFKKNLVLNFKKNISNFFRKKSVRKRRVRRESATLEEYLRDYKLESRASLGRAYHVRRYISFLFSGIGKFIYWTMSFVSKNTARASVLLVIFVLIGGVTPFVSSAPKSVNVSLRSEWETGTLTNINTTASTDAIQLEADGTWTARSWAPTPDTMNNGSTSVMVGNYLYAPRGWGGNYLYRYDTQKNKWDTMSNSPEPFSTGADGVYDGTDNIYFTFGNYSKKLYKYSISNDSWIELPDLPDTIAGGSRIAFDGTDVYITRGVGANDFWKFDVSENSFVYLAPITAGVNTGSSLVYGENGYFYVHRGSNVSTLYRYDIAANSWSTMSNSPAVFPYSDHKGVLRNSHIYFLIYNGTFLRYSIIGDSWETLDNSPYPTGYSSLSYNSNDGYIYAIRGNGQYNLWKFDPEAGTTGKWVGPKDFPLTAYTGSDLIWNGVEGAGAYIYAPRGNSVTFYRFDIAANDWSTMANSPANLNYDNKGTYHNGKIYIPAGNTATLVIYDVASNSWSTSSAASAVFSNGASAIYHDGFIYANRGGATNQFFKYDIAGDSWAVVSNIIATSGTDYRIHLGGRLESDGTYVYATAGDGEKAFLRYNASLDSWEELARTPFAQFYGTDITYHNGKIYALAGWYKDETWEYDVASDSWRQLPKNQDNTFERGPYAGASIEYAGGGSLYAAPGLNVTDFWSYTLGTNKYVSSGTYVSESIDLSYADSWISLNATENKPANTSITYETRTSADGSSWSEWQAVSGASIQSPPNRYAQVRITLASSDGVNTPSVSDFTISYNSEDDAPINPTGVNAYSQEISGALLVSGMAYSHTQPYFSWSGASDLKSGIKGYWVYFGSNLGADPATEGIFQTTDSFKVNLAMTTGNYYLRIKTEDNDGNISSTAWEAFAYNYAGVSPYVNVEKTTQADFDAGTFSSASTLSDGSLRLSSVDGFWNEALLSYAPLGMNYGGGLEYVESEGKLYTFRGGNQLQFYSYDLSTATWATLSDTPAIVGDGGEISAGPSGYLYGTRGGNTTEFWRYDIVQNIWETMANSPKVFGAGGSMTYDNNRYIYAFPGYNDDVFYRYDTQANTWSAMPLAQFGNPNANDGQRIYSGSDSVYDGTNAIYIIQGGQFPYLSKYAISENIERGEAASTWYSLKKAPIAINTGGAITYDSITNSLFVLSGGNRREFFRYDIATDEWFETPQFPSNVGNGSSLTAIGEHIYALRGNGSNMLYRFNIDENSWKLPQRGFFGSHDYNGNSYFQFYQGADMADDGNGNLYMFRGYYDDLFGKYNIDSGEFVLLAKTPVGIANGASMVYNKDEGAIYALSGDIRTIMPNNANRYFMKYDVSGNTWEILSSDPIQYKTGIGSSMFYDGERYIYLTRGAGTNHWWRYDTQATEGSRWSGLLPTIAGWSQGYGSRMVPKNGYIYTARGGNVNTFWRYDIAGGLWLQMADMPDTVHYGGSLEDGQDGYLYAMKGTNTGVYMRYSISLNIWETLDNIPANVSWGGSSEQSNDRIWLTSGTGSYSYNDGLYSYVIGSEANGTGFEKTGEYVSESIDLISTYRWANLEMTYAEPANTSLTVYTRSSEDGIDWSSWDQTSNKKYLGSNRYRYNIVSPANNYIQIKISMTSSDQIYSPTVSDYSINYYQDIQVPTNPSSISAYSSNLKSTAVSDATWYNHTAPYFEWPAAETTGGATDGSGGSGVAGYWVYFGTNAMADPYIDGNYQATVTYTADSLVSGENYYLLIKTVDDAGMIATDSWTAFNYKFDNTAPVNPSDISVTPTGFTASDNYVFLWESNVSDAGAGVQKFQYRTGGDTEGVWYDIANPAEVTISLPNAEHIVGAYQSGKNWFYLRAVDMAGNASLPISQEYYYSASAPSPPENLVVTPTNSVENSFSFSWDKPGSFIGEESKLKYFYSINTLPTQYNVVETVSTFAGPGPFATQKGSNNFYVVAMDEAGNIDYSLYASVEFHANTTAPGAPVNLQIFDTSDRENEAYSIALKWTKPDGIDDANFAGYVIHRSDNNVNFSQVATTSGTAYVDSELESKLYYYYVKARDLTNNLSIASSITNITPTGRYTSPPLLIQEPKITTQSFAASFNWATNRVASSFVEFGKTISLGETNGQVDSVTDHTVNVTGLSAATKYFYRVKYIDPDGNIGTSEIGNFITLDPPIVSEFSVGDIGLSSAYVSWKTNTAATCTLKYGAGGSYSNSIEETGSASSHMQKIEGLVAETSYQAQVACLDGDLNEFDSDQYNFSTPIKPVSSNIKIENKDNVDSPTVIVEYTTNVPTTTHIYFKNSEEASPRTYLAEEKVTEHKAEIAGLDPDKEYVLMIAGTDANGISVETTEQRITTRSDSRPPEILINRAVGKVLGRGNDSQANMYVKIETNEPTKLKIKYSKGVTVSGFDQSTGESALNTYHLITVPAEIGQIYSYQVEAFDEAGNMTLTKVATVIVEEAKSSASEIIMGTTAKQFGWISEIWK